MLSFSFLEMKRELSFRLTWGNGKGIDPFGDIVKKV